MTRKFMTLFLVFSIIRLSIMIALPQKSYAIPDKEFQEILMIFENDTNLIIKYQKQKNFWTKSKAIWTRQKGKSIIELSIIGSDVSIYMIGGKEAPTVASAGTKIRRLKFATTTTTSSLTTWGYLAEASVSSLILYNYLEGENIELTQAIVDEIIKEVKYRKLYVTENSNNSDEALIIMNDIAKEVAGRYKS